MINFGERILVGLERILVGLMTICILVLITLVVLRKPTTFQPQPAQVAQPQSRPKAAIQPFEPAEKFVVADEPAEYLSSTLIARVFVVRERDGRILSALASPRTGWGANLLVQGTPVKLVRVRIDPSPSPLLTEFLAIER